MSAQPRAFVVGLEENGLAVARALGREGVRVTAVSDRADLPGRWTRFADVTVVPGLHDSISEVLVELARPEPVPPVLFLTRDQDVLTVNRERDRLAGFLQLAFPDESLVDVLMSKRGFFDLAHDLGAPLPATFCVDSAEQLASVLDEVPFPCILKPQEKTPTYMARAAKAYKVGTREELLHRYEEVSEFEPRMVVQEFVPGGDGTVYFCLQYYSTSGLLVESFEGRKIRQWVPECGGTASAEPVVEPELRRITERFFSAAGFRGLCSMEYKRDPRNGRFLMIEPTVCRTDFQSGISVANGVNLPWLAYCDLAGLQLPEVHRSDRPVKWVHYLYDCLSADYYISKGQLSKTEWKKSLRGPKVFPFFSWRDPMPGAFVLSGKIAGRMRRLLNRNK